MKILWQNEHYPDPVKGGGGAINTYYIVSALQQLGNETVILSRGPKGCRSFREQVNGTTVQRVAPAQAPDKLWPVWPLLETRYVLPALHDIISSFDLFIGIDYSFALAVKKLYPRRPLIYRVEGSRRTHDAAVGALGDNRSNGLGFKRRYLRRLLVLENDFMERRAWKACDAIVIKSRFMKREMETLCDVSPDKMHVIPNGVDYARYANAKARCETRARLHFEPGKIVIIFCGRLVRMKNVSFLLRAVAQMRLKDQVILAILGEGEERPILETEAQQLGMAMQTRFLGHSDHVEEFLSAADIFVLPSVYEPFGNALVEAMAAGLPSVALKPDSQRVRTASDEILEEGVTGHLVASERHDEMSQTLDRLVQNAELRQRLGAAAQSQCRKKYSWDACARAYLSLAEDSRAG